MIGFDLDGVLISDLRFPDNMSIEEFLEMRKSEPMANFVPRGDYVIVTGRNSTDVSYTMDWIKENLASNMPFRVFHDCPNYTLAAQYKAKIINTKGIRVFIESDKKQVEYLKENCPYCRVVHFSDYISQCLNSI